MVEKLPNTIRVFLKDTSLEFCISKCSHISVKIGKLVRICGVKISFGEIIPELESDKSHKYLEILQANNIMHNELKGKIQKEYYKKVRQLI